MRQPTLPQRITLHGKGQASDEPARRYPLGSHFTATSSRLLCALFSIVKNGRVLQLQGVHLFLVSLPKKSKQGESRGDEMSLRDKWRF